MINLSDPKQNMRDKIGPSCAVIICHDAVMDFHMNSHKMSQYQCVCDDEH